jgi:hypothetical protein
VVSYHPDPPQPLRARHGSRSTPTAATTSTGPYTTSGDATDREKQGLGIGFNPWYQAAHFFGARVAVRELGEPRFSSRGAPRTARGGDSTTLALRCESLTATWRRFKLTRT